MHNGTPLTRETDGHPYRQNIPTKSKHSKQQSRRLMTNLAHKSHSGILSTYAGRQLQICHHGTSTQNRHPEQTKRKQEQEIGGKDNSPTSTQAAAKNVTRRDTTRQQVCCCTSDQTHEVRRDVSRDGYLPEVCNLHEREFLARGKVCFLDS